MMLPNKNIDSTYFTRCLVLGDLLTSASPAKWNMNPLASLRALRMPMGQVGQEKYMLKGNSSLLTWGFELE